MPNHVHGIIIIDKLNNPVVDTHVCGGGCCGGGRDARSCVSTEKQCVSTEKQCVPTGKHYVPTKKQMCQTINLVPNPKILEQLFSIGTV